MVERMARMESKESGDFSHIDDHLRRKGNNLLCCVDGSIGGDLTLQTAFELRKKHDHVTVFHAFKEFEDDSKVFPVSYRPKEMKMKYECELVGHLPSSKYSIWWINREPSGQRKAIEELRHEMLERKHDADFPDFVLMGHVGRKGKKNSTTSLGSNSDVSLRTLHLPIILVKQPCPSSDRTFMLSVNDSSYSERGLDVILSLVRPRDGLHLFHFYTPGSEEDLQRAQLLRLKYEDELKEYGPVDSTFTLVEKPQGKAMTHCIVDYVNEKNPSFLGICPRGRASISSLSEYVVNNVSCSVVFCKT